MEFDPDPANLPEGQSMSDDSAPTGEKEYWHDKRLGTNRPTALSASEPVRHEMVSVTGLTLALIHRKTSGDRLWGTEPSRMGRSCRRGV